MEKSEFLSFLVDETLKLHNSGERKLSLLEHKLSDYGLNFLKGEFIPQINMLRFTSNFGVLDIPINWPLFEADGYTLLDAESDRDHFFSVMKAAWNLPIETLLIMHADGFCFLVAMKVGEDSFLNDLVNPQEWLQSA